MSIIAYYDEHSLKVTNLARLDRSSGSTRKTGAAQSPWESAPAGEAPAAGRSVAHSRRYTDIPGSS